MRLFETRVPLASSVQDVPVIFNSNGIQSFSKALVDLYKHGFCITELT